MPTRFLERFLPPEDGDGPIWSPGDGDAALDALPEGVLVLLHVGLQAALDALVLTGPAPDAVVVNGAAARIAFRDCTGGPVPVAGELRLGGEVLRFSGVSVIRAWG